jgi:hypothetical protein
VTACAHTADPVLTLNKTVPANCVAAKRHSCRFAGSESTSCIQPAPVKNQEPTKHNTFAVPAGSPSNGTVATAKNNEPTAKSQH